MLFMPKIHQLTLWVEYSDCVSFEIVSFDEMICKLKNKEKTDKENLVTNCLFVYYLSYIIIHQLMLSRVGPLQKQWRKEIINNNN